MPDRSLLLWKKLKKSRMIFPASGLYTRLVCYRPLWLSGQGGGLEIEQEVSNARPRFDGSL